MQNNKMKNLLLIACLTIWSCSNQTDKNSNSADTTAVIINQTISTDTSKSKSQDNFNLADTLSAINNVTSVDSTPIQINTTFPFGCANLTKLKYPKVWEGEGDGTLKQPQGKEFDKIDECFRKINSAKTIKLPEILKLEHLKIGKNPPDISHYDTIVQRSFDSCRYRLPDVGIYNCYYSYRHARNRFGLYGNILFFDPKTKIGKTLNIYHENGGVDWVNLRYFYMDMNVIKIYEGSCSADDCSLVEAYTITINQDGKIIIKQNHE